MFKYLISSAKPNSQVHETLSRYVYAYMCMHIYISICVVIINMEKEDQTIWWEKF